MNLKALKIRLIVNHTTIVNVNSQYLLLSKIKRILRTKRFSNEKLSFFKTIESSTQKDQLNAESIRIWLLTTWQSFNNHIANDKIFQKKHVYIHHLNRKKFKNIEIIHWYHCDFAIIDDVYFTKNIRVDPFFNFENMIANRSNHSFWYFVLFDIVISFDSIEIMTSSSIMKNAIRNTFEYDLNSLIMQLL